MRGLLCESNSDYFSALLKSSIQFSLPYLVQINVEVNAKALEEGLEVVPMNVFAKGGHNALEQLVNSGYFKLLYLFMDHLIAIY